MGNAAILLAGGSGSRMRGTVEDKVLAQLSGIPVILHSLRAFLDSASVAEVVFVCRDSVQEAAIKALIEKYFPKIGLSVKFARGGAERQDSVLNGLRAVSDKSGLAFIHDGARPMVGAENIARLAGTALRDGAAVLAARAVDTIKRLPKGKKNLSKCRLADLERGRLWAMQTPQVFRAAEILDAYEHVKKNSIKITDDVAAAASLGIRVSIVENFSPNPKITVPEDIALAEYLMSRGSPKSGRVQEQRKEQQ